MGSETLPPLLPVVIILLVIATLIWTLFSTRYTMLDNELLLQSAFMRKRIRYKDITGIRAVRGISEMMKGFQMHTAKNGLEVFYETNRARSIKISPKQEERFLIELLQRCDHLQSEKAQ